MMPWRGQFFTPECYLVDEAYEYGTEELCLFLGRCECATYERVDIGLGKPLVLGRFIASMSAAYGIWLAELHQFVDWQQLQWAARVTRSQLLEVKKQTRRGKKFPRRMRKAISTSGFRFLERYLVDREAAGEEDFSLNEGTADWIEHEFLYFMQPCHDRWIRSIDHALQCYAECLGATGVSRIRPQGPAGEGNSR